MKLIDCEVQVSMEASMRMLHLCPVKDETDDGTVKVCWMTNGSTIELHSLAEYLSEFATVAITHEDLVDQIAEDIAKVAKGSIQEISVSFTGFTAGMSIQAESWPS